MTGPVSVVAAVILRGGRVLVTRRPRGGRLAGKWEFPGGKVEPGERPAAALAREILEELGCEVAVGRRLCRVTTRHPQEWVRLDFRRCRILRGEPQGREGQRVRWATPALLGRLPFPPADGKVLALISRRGFLPSPSPRGRRRSSRARTGR